MRFPSTRPFFPRHLMRIALAFLLLGTALIPVRPATATANYDSEVATAWFNLALQLVKSTPGYTPPVASRAYAYLGLALYETVQPGAVGYQSLVGQLNGLEQLPKPNTQTGFHWPSAANFALAATTRYLFPSTTPENLAAIDALEARFVAEYQPTVEPVVFAHSKIWGRSVANTLFAWSKSDGGHAGYVHNFPDDYTAPNGPGLWESVSETTPQPLQPYWGANRPFVLPTGDTCPAASPFPYSEDPNSDFYLEAQEVYQVGKTRTPEQTDIALYWADDPGITATPSGHWIAILTQILRQEEAPLDFAAEAYAKLGLTVADAFITCWQTKYFYNMERPVTYIRSVIDPTWNTGAQVDPVGTPPFPEYTSGHSVQSAAAATVLTSLFGNDYAFIDNTHAALGLAPRAFGSFTAAAEEAAISRLYGGIHYRAAIEQGMVQGRCVGEHTLALQFHD